MHPKTGISSFPVDLIRTIAIILVILLHASTQSYPDVGLMSPQGVQIWWASNVYDSISRVCVPLFVMLAGALLLQPSKADEPLKVFFKKRLNRIGIPFLFWGAIYFAWRLFVNGEKLTTNSIVQGVLGGPYYQFWFLYLLLGLYIVTPVLRVVIKHADWKILRYLIFVWFVGTAIIPLLTLFGSYSLNANVFIFTGWLGYFVLGAYLLKVQFKSSILTLVLVLSYLWTIMGTYLVIATMGERFGTSFWTPSASTSSLLQRHCFCCWLRFQAKRLHTVFLTVTGCSNLLARILCRFFCSTRLFWKFCRKGIFLDLPSA